MSNDGGYNGDDESQSKSPVRSNGGLTEILTEILVEEGDVLNHIKILDFVIVRIDDLDFVLKVSIQEHIPIVKSVTPLLPIDIDLSFSASHAEPSLVPDSQIEIVSSALKNNSDPPQTEIVSSVLRDSDPSQVIKSGSNDLVHLCSPLPSNEIVGFDGDNQGNEFGSEK
ncbi:hypothetical protein ACFE04_010869 [Oxalis oulophora]